MEVFAVRIALIMLVALAVILAEIHNIVTVVVNLIRVDKKIACRRQHLRMETYGCDIQAQRRGWIVQAFARVSPNVRKFRC